MPEEANEREAAAGNLEEKQRPPCAALLEREIDARLEDGDREGAARAANALGEMLLGEERLSVTRPIAGRSAWVSRGGSHRRSPHISEGRVRARPRACPARLSGGLQEPQGDRGLPRQAALLPLASGTDVFILLGREESYDKALLVAIGLFGFAVTLGLFVYERGIQDCITLRKRTERMEKGLGIPANWSHFHRPQGKLGGVVDEVGCGLDRLHGRSNVLGSTSLCSNWSRAGGLGCSGSSSA